MSGPSRPNTAAPRDHRTAEKEYSLRCCRQEKFEYCFVPRSARWNLRRVGTFARAAPCWRRASAAPAGWSAWGSRGLRNSRRAMSLPYPAWQIVALGTLHGSGGPPPHPAAPRWPWLTNVFRSAAETCGVIGVVLSGSRERIAGLVCREAVRRHRHAPGPRKRIVAAHARQRAPERSCWKTRPTSWKRHSGRQCASPNSKPSWRRNWARRPHRTTLRRPPRSRCVPPLTGSRWPHSGCW